jgi:type IV secretion system protein VirB9
MRQQVYNPAGRTLLVGTVGRATILTFGPDEQIKRVVTGSAGFWAVPDGKEIAQSPLNNVLPLWAEKAGRTTLQVVTAKPGMPDRVYQFSAEVRALPKCGVEDCEDDPNAIYGLTFIYPDDERAKKAAETAEARRIAGERAATARRQREHLHAVARLEQDFTCRNGLYEARGDRSIVPDDACDDGQRIGMMFRGNRQLPAVFLIGADGKEQSVSFSVRGDWVIVPALRERIILRLGETSALEVVNRAFNARGYSPNTGTPSPDVVREVVQARP